MPLYDYVCVACRSRFEQQRYICDRDAEPRCPHCASSKVQRSKVNPLHLNGSSPVPATEPHEDRTNLKDVGWNVTGGGNVLDGSYISGFETGINVAAEGELKGQGNWISAATTAINVEKDGKLEMKGLDIS